MVPYKRGAGANQAAIAERRARVADMLLARVPQREIARRCGVALGTISDDVRSIKQDWYDRAAASYMQHVAEEVAKLDLLERLLIPRVVGGELAAVDRMLKVMVHRAALLNLEHPPNAFAEVQSLEARRTRTFELLRAAMGEEGDTIIDVNDSGLPSADT
jgi:hypothetical protein